MSERHEAPIIPDRPQKQYNDLPREAQIYLAQKRKDMFATFKKLVGDGTVEEQWHAIVHHPDEHILEAALFAMQEYEDALEDPYLEFKGQDDPSEVKLRDHIGKEKEFLYVGHFIPAGDPNATAVAKLNTTDKPYRLIRRDGSYISNQAYTDVRETTANVHIVRIQEGIWTVLRPNGSWIYDEGGEVVIESATKEAIAFLLPDDEYKILRLSDGKIITKELIVHLGPVHNNLAPVQLTNGSWTVLDLESEDFLGEYGFISSIQDGWQRMRMPSDQMGAHECRLEHNDGRSFEFKTWEMDSITDKLPTFPFQNLSISLTESNELCILNCDTGDIESLGIDRDLFLAQDKESFYYLSKDKPEVCCMDIQTRNSKKYCNVPFGNSVSYLGSDLFTAEYIREDVDTGYVLFTKENKTVTSTKLPILQENRILIAECFESSNSRHCYDIFLDTDLNEIGRYKVDANPFFQGTAYVRDLNGPFYIDRDGNRLFHQPE